VTASGGLVVGSPSAAGLAAAEAVFAERLRIERRTDAAEQGMAVARNILAGPSVTAFRTVPCVWSDQYDLKVQIHGRTRGADAVHLVHGSLKRRSFTALYVRDGVTSPQPWASA
jgi:NADPH-dependent 2,4-dienoyl-CoA reductase/sulfur reductase-like enzyme